jgi:hypothetical protein
MRTNTTAIREKVQTHRPNCFTRLPDRKKEEESVHWKDENNNNLVDIYLILLY